jgi:tetratricopeptide (TPR) repeat protein
VRPKGEAALRFDPARLRALAGDKAFARGEAYHAEGAVTLLLVEPGRVLANVRGTETYRVELLGGGRAVQGTCNCQAFADWGFCKHLVATALAANEVPAQGEAEAGALPRLRAYLATQSAETLAALVLELAGRDAALLRRLDDMAALRGAPTVAARRIATMIERAVALDYDLDHGAVDDWAGELGAALDGVAGLIAAGEAAAALELAARAIEGLETALESLADHEGEGSDLLERACALHHAAALAARPDPVALAGWLFELEVGAGFADFEAAEERYAEALGAAGLAEYRRLAAAAWARVPARAPAKPGRRRSAEAEVEADLETEQVMGILDRAAAAAGDLEARIALRAKDLSGPRQHLALAQFCLEAGRPEEALRRSGEALWLFEDQAPDEALLRFHAECLALAGRGAEAEPLLWRGFERQPSRALYDALGRAGGPAAAERARALLLRQLTDPPPTRPGAFFGWGRPALLAQILLDEGRHAEAWAVAAQHQLGWAIGDRLVKASGRAFPQAAVALLAREVESRIAGTDYAEAVALLGRMAALQDAKAQATYVAALRERHARKRNLMKLLR